MTQRSTHFYRRMAVRLRREAREVLAAAGARADEMERQARQYDVWAKRALAAAAPQPSGAEESTA